VISIFEEFRNVIPKGDVSEGRRSAMMDARQKRALTANEPNPG
jgi:hypothetical protein